MSSEIITTKRDTEIGRLLERVIRDHRKDIADFSKGHLNENNLYKPPETNRVSWDSAKRPGIKLRNPVSVPKTERSHRMWEAVTCFSAGSAFPKETAVPKQRRESSPKEPNDNVYLEELDATYFMVPKSRGNHIIPSLNGGLTRREELRQRRFIDDAIVERRNLTDKGWFDGSRAVQGIHRDDTAPQAYSRMWDELLSRCSMYDPLLSEIKQFYMGYLAFLRDKEAARPGAGKFDGKELRLKKGEIAKRSKRVQELEDKAMNLISTNKDLKNQREVAEQTLSEVKISLASMEEESVKSSCSSSVVPISESLATTVEQLRRAILQKRADIEEVRARQRRVMVPMEVQQCMVQCVQGAEVELQKQTKILEAITKQKHKNELALEAEIAKFSLTAEERAQVWDLFSTPPAEE